MISCRDVNNLQMDGMELVAGAAGLVDVNQYRSDMDCFIPLMKNLIPQLCWGEWSKQ